MTEEFSLIYLFIQCRPDDVRRLEIKVRHYLLIRFVFLASRCNLIYSINVYLLTDAERNDISTPALLHKETWYCIDHELEKIGREEVGKICLFGLS